MKKELEALESEIESIELEISQVEVQMSDQETYANLDKLAVVNKQYEMLKTKLADRNNNWEQLVGVMEELE